MKSLPWSLAVWGVWLAYFLVVELAAVFLKGRVPWFTLSRTTWTLEDKWAPLSFLILFGLAVLMVHIFAGGPIKLAAAGTRKLARRVSAGPPR
jgi:hypothetical protein